MLNYILEFVIIVGEILHDAVLWRNRKYTVIIYIYIYIYNLYWSFAAKANRHYLSIYLSLCLRFPLTRSHMIFTRVCIFLLHYKIKNSGTFYECRFLTFGAIT